MGRRCRRAVGNGLREAHVVVHGVDPRARAADEEAEVPRPIAAEPATVMATIDRNARGYEQTASLLLQAGVSPRTRKQNGL